MFMLKNQLIFLLCLLTIYTQIIDGQSNCLSPIGLQGSCIPIKQCAKILKILTAAPKPLPNSVINYLRQYQCGFDQNQPKVCCEYGNDGITPITSTTTPVDSTYQDDTIQHRNVHLLPLNTCGPIWTDKISGGNKTDLFEFPWMALLQYETNDGLKFLCGGSLINERYVLTAAHCVTKLLPTNKLVSVRLGEHDINSEVDCQTIEDEKVCAEPVQDIEVDEIIFHPNYDRPKWSNDVAVIRLKRTANLKPESVRPVCLPITPDLENLTPKRVSISGWGTTEKQTTSPDLLQASLPVVTNVKCQEYFRRAIQIMPSQMCAGGEMGIDSCKGDSGGPLVYPATLRGTKIIQFGIISVGISTCTTATNFPGVYTRVSYYIPWILNQLKP